MGRSSSGGFGVLLAAAFIFANAQWIVVFCLLLIFLAATAKLILVLSDRKTERLRYYAEMDANRRARADYENMLANEGDPMGVYGRYTPPTLPITGPMYPRPDWSEIIQYGGIE